MKLPFIKRLALKSESPSYRVCLLYGLSRGAISIRRGDQTASSKRRSL
jgi:hypothetical protein